MEGEDLSLDSNTQEGSRTQSGDEVTLENAPSQAPEGMPPEIWDTDKGEVRGLYRRFWKGDTLDMPGLLKSFEEKETFISQGKHKMPGEGVPDAPEGYAINVPEAFVAEGQDLSDDKLFERLKPIAHRHNVSQEFLDDAVAAIFETQAAIDATDQEARREIYEQTAKALGDSPKAVVGGLKDWLDGYVSRGEMSADMREQITAFTKSEPRLLPVFQFLRDQTKEISIPVDGTATGDKPDLDKIAADPRWDHNHPEHAKFVKEIDRLDAKLAVGV